MFVGAARSKIVRRERFLKRAKAVLYGRYTSLAISRERSSYRHGGCGV